ncbi:CoA-binding protein [Paenarthrobacter sp. CCNWLY172]|uniref:CoA-binding protein n=1 Tax=Paenarthrobacter sp. AMU7 TaxID=3162492 RepID=A0AB39YTR9_9MICC|nr:CoA-binding protein [Arthrobacter sp. D5-1]QSZ47579.1 CoA-binding protein [Arthrobacter sp. D5-1]
MMHVNDPDVVERLMRTKGTWAIVGLSTNQWRSAYEVSLYVRDTMGMEIIPVNLKGEDVHGEKGYPTLADIPAARHPIDVVECFVNSQRVGAVIDQAIAIGAKAVWLQLGVFDDEATQRAKDAGLEVVVNSCPAREGWHYGL